MAPTGLPQPRDLLVDARTGLLAGREQFDRALDVFGTQPHVVHDASRGLNLFLGNAPVHFGQVTHDEESRLEKHGLDCGTRRIRTGIIHPAPESRIQIPVEQMADQSADQSAREATAHKPEHQSGQLAEPESVLAATGAPGRAHASVPRAEPTVKTTEKAVVIIGRGGCRIPGFCEEPNGNDAK